MKRRIRMILDHFPEELGTIRRSQEVALIEIEKAIKSGVKTISLEAPTGTGKTAIAETMFKWMRDEGGSADAEGSTRWKEGRARALGGHCPRGRRAQVRG